MVTPRAPDPAWVATLKEGDRVAVAENGLQLYHAIVLRVTPDGLLKVGQPHSALRHARAFCGPREHSSHRLRPGYATGVGPYSSRYLVPVESKP